MYSIYWFLLQLRGEFMRGPAHNYFEGLTSLNRLITLQNKEINNDLTSAVSQMTFYILTAFTGITAFSMGTYFIFVNSI